MKAETFLRSLTYLSDAYLDELEHYDKEIKMTEKNHGIKSYRAVFALAAAIALLLALGVAAYALDLFGFKALVRPVEVPEYYEGLSSISLTQPQAVPDGFDSSINENIANSRAAWEEWQNWMKEHQVPLYSDIEGMPEVFIVPVGNSAAIELNEDGSATVRVLSDTEVEYVNGVAVLATVERRHATAEEFALFEKLTENYDNFESAYDFNYWSFSEEADEALKQIADKYGLDLRDAGQVGWSGQMEWDIEGENIERYFKIPPTGFEKAYWYSDGSFGFAYYADLLNGDTAYCYGYNSMYSTLSSGGEVINWEDDLSAFSERSYVALDGTTVTVLSNNEQAYIYVYLDNSFFAMSIAGETALSDENINYIADGLAYSLMGR